MSARCEKKRRPGLILLAVILALLALCWLYLDGNLTEVVLSLADARARSLAVQVLNEAVEETLASGVSYDQLMSVTTGPDGTVRFVQANTAEMNRLASRVTLLAQKKLEELEDQVISVPLGSALGLTIFAGSGPRIQVRILPVGAVIPRFDTEFQTAGINQTRHKLLLTLTATVRLVIPTGAAVMEASTQMAVAESIIVGQVPDSFVDLNGDSDMLDLIP
ncbi:MAG: sporulation protein YunB [Clostridiales bacterium]|nr:sporulation protein YunB [Clostridiales bacterium]